ncbi:hypothetical protein OM076_41555 [Solirubrobacter ginsenosidimutans]|uniref:Uncharacterized protein n=2 Tax=Solirubrobacter ginsenosidimutans TaxID=490573 RepID=A0A9X3N1B5_9ACTN|nr:hypothetical protein [Solirubrobacter ginsenosidimutans]
MMTGRIATRLEELRSELALGERRLQELDRERLDVQQTLLRIAGAVQVLQELLDEESAASNGAVPSVVAD